MTGMQRAPSVATKYVCLITHSSKLEHQKHKFKALFVWIISLLTELYRAGTWINVRIHISVLILLLIILIKLFHHGVAWYFRDVE